MRLPISPVTDLTSTLRAAAISMRREPPPLLHLSRKTLTSLLVASALSGIAWATLLWIWFGKG